MYAQFDRFEIKMTLKQAQSVSHQGKCDEDVQELLKDKKFLTQIQKIDLESIRMELREYGAWDEEELMDYAANLQRVTWIAGCNIVEEYKQKEK